MQIKRLSDKDIVYLPNLSIQLYISPAHAGT